MAILPGAAIHLMLGTGLSTCITVLPTEEYEHIASDKRRIRRIHREFEDSSELYEHRYRLLESYGQGLEQDGSLQSKLNDAEEGKRSAEHKLEATKKEHEAKIKRYKEHFRAADKAVKAANEKSATASALQQEDRVAVGKAKKINDTLSSNLDDVKKLRNQLKTENEALKAENTTVQSDNDALRSENRTLKAQNNTLQPEKDALKSQSEALMSDKAKLDESLKSCQAELIALMQQIEHLQAEVEGEATQRASLEADLTIKENELRWLWGRTDILITVREDLVKAIGTACITREIQPSEYGDRVWALEATPEEITSSTRRDINMVTKTLDTLVGSMTTFRNRVATANTRFREKRKIIETLASDRTDLRKMVWKLWSWLKPICEDLNRRHEESGGRLPGCWFDFREVDELVMHVGLPVKAPVRAHEGPQQMSGHLV